jgi:SOS response regulatory protein OraA/RecX
MQEAWKRAPGNKLLLLVGGEEVLRVSLRIVSANEAFSLSELSPEAIDKALIPFEEKGGMRLAISLLSKQACHSNKLREHLKKHYIRPSIIEKIIAECTKNTFLNDAAWVERRVETLRSRGKSSREISFRLKSVQEKASNLGSDAEALEKIIRKKYVKLLHPDLTQKDKAKIFNALLRRGFSLQDVQEAFIRLKS